MPRMNILNAVEQEAFESAPAFNSFQRKQYFDFQQATANLHTPANQFCFLLSCGYFKASKRCHQGKLVGAGFAGDCIARERSLRKQVIQYRSCCGVQRPFDGGRQPLILGRRADAQRGGEERYSFDRCLRLQRVGLRREPPVGLFLRAALQKPPAPEALYFQESQGVRPFRLEDQARRLCR